MTNDSTELSKARNLEHTKLLSLAFFPWLTISPTSYLAFMHSSPDPSIISSSYGHASLPSRCFHEYFIVLLASGFLPQTGNLKMPSWTAKGRLPCEFWRKQVMGARPGTERIDPSLLSEWGFLDQSLASRKENRDTLKQAWVQKCGSSSVWLTPHSGIDAVGKSSLLTLLETPKPSPTRFIDTWSMFLHTFFSLPFFPSFYKTVFFHNSVKVSQQTSL